jgi:hypothetical protein
MVRTVTSRNDGMSDDALEKATGRPWGGWFELLDEAGATGWKHPAIAAWLHDEHGVPAWWCQMVAVGFEQARGMRQPGQRADGTFDVSASKSLPLDQQAALDAVITAVSAALGTPPHRQSRNVKFITARWELGEREFLLATASPASGGKTSVSLTHQRMPLAERVAPAKAAMQVWLAAAAL